MDFIFMNDIKECFLCWYNFKRDFYKHALKCFYGKLQDAWGLLIKGEG